MKPLTSAVIFFALLQNVPFICAAENQIEQLRWIEKANPVADADAALKKNDKRLLAVYGYTIVIPGIPEAKASEYKDRFGIRVLEGTSDAAKNKEHLLLIERATKYASNYNQHLLKQLGVQSNAL